jgi:flavin reductase (DIM6/NTAB) family NADH-FMN oxidoreductase RutF
MSTQNTLNSVFKLKIVRNFLKRKQIPDSFIDHKNSTYIFTRKDGGMNEIKADDLKLKITDLWSRQWLVLTAGTMQDFNSMTIGWGSVGVMWRKPFVQVVVRPGRYTFEFMEKYPTFTVCAFPEHYRDAVKLLGTQSGRNSDKIEDSGLTILKSNSIDAPAYEEAELILECRKMYWQDMNPGHFLDNELDNNYPKKDYHRIYFGEIVNIRGESSFSD